MPRIGVFSGAEVCRILEQHGFVEVRQRGGHIVMQKVSEGRAATVPVPNHRTVQIGTLLSIIRQSGVPRDAFTR